MVKITPRYSRIPPIVAKERERRLTYGYGISLIKITSPLVKMCDSFPHPEQN